eukprot:TRINITY_DN26997_c0_g1_i7.p1 TRINITY_DN26997_c0_g1~~TRINITY_DN26997_c0_g1_i7.p1  ORF type:complete len:111 (-),score=18.50 TRINITY_DN26997_c0_g1_i7:49-381(-)
MAISGCKERRQVAVAISNRRALGDCLLHQSQAALIAILGCKVRRQVAIVISQRQALLDSPHGHFGLHSAKAKRHDYQPATSSRGQLAAAIASSPHGHSLLQGAKAGSHHF